MHPFCFIPTYSCIRPPRHSSPRVTCHETAPASSSSSMSKPQSTPRRTFLHQALTLTTTIITTTVPSPTLSEPTSDPKVYFDISVAGRPKGRITIQLFAKQAPSSTETFMKLAKGTLKNKSGTLSASYNRSVGSRVIKDTRVYLGKLNQIDSLNQSPGIAQRQQPTVQYPFNNDENDLKHDQKGIVSIQKNGSYEFLITDKPTPDQDDSRDRLVIGKVIDGIEVVDALVQIPTNQKTIRDGYRQLGKAIGDPRAKVPVCLSFFSRPFKFLNFLCIYPFN